MEYNYSDYNNYAQSYERPRPTEHYDTDQGKKKSLFREVEDSPKKYSILTSRVDRFKEPNHQAPFADYNLDTAHKKTIKNGIDASPVKYAATFSKRNRFAKDKISDAPDKMYDTNTLHLKTLDKNIEESSVNYANVRSNAPRFGRKGLSFAPDVLYDTDQMGKASLQTAVSSSPVRYAMMKSNQPRLKERAQGCTDGELGPGTYETPCHLDLKKDWTQRSMSSFASSVPRFNSQRDPTKYLGSTYTPERDRKAWGKKHFKISSTKIQRPAYLPNVYQKT
ncbi:hypothetical protein CYMTET_53665 [Cymbomonas tetramitiformis]|uniref:Uncharacterized protein n=1 Tax=Cymbomonas tetramitiformis TaxID=36881 RepID=A0AAE0BGR7_9CHLO|nr:hypothetical protein CYMTET_53665 [Cymbomonas tetramitiformis]